MKRKKCLAIVYGTLKKGYHNFAVIDHPTTKFLGEVETPAAYTLYDGGYPVVERGGETPIKGELYELNNEEVIARMFGLEGCYSQTKGPHNDFYDIDELDTEHGKAVIFVMDRGKSGRTKVIQSGRWER